nr:MAG TPA: YvrJ protein family protein [Caudoviricetes sp.]
MLTTKSAIKWIILIVATTLMQIETIRIKGHWIAGGNVAFPFLMALLLWYVPSRIEEFMGLVKEEILKEKNYVDKNQRRFI